ncbi:riboflavin biosynthesis protein RibF [Mesoterricola silvestris]|uniref:Riboflavin biosynthesis protein n=1 Tax=Mesoterricola silvestris TaxID=2927979 RepID=A0AA48KBA1_9BACT|nr:riboflavin biosynthesis protein RibF [Mesoterricola silvestris]BDU74870.1 riboflavin biosynthesis protein [Mesoterricola silvestris]
MRIWTHALEAAPAQGPCVVTLGNFDGVHAAHHAVLELAASRARELGLTAAVVTFDPHPSVVVAPERKPKLLMTLPQRLEAFRIAGMDLAWVIPFSRAFSELSPAAFLEGLERALAPRELHVGRQFRFGKDRAGTLDALEAWGRQAGCEIHAHALRAPDGGHLSSTRIRAALEAGDVEEAAALLGHPYALTGIVVEGERRGRQMGFPTANLAWEQGQLPGNGVYVTEVAGPHLPSPLRGLTNVGEKPTFQGRAITVETHLPGFQGDLYGAPLAVRFLHRIRGEMRFAGVEELRAQIARDVASGLAWRAEGS